MKKTLLIAALSAISLLSFSQSVIKFRTKGTEICESEDTHKQLVWKSHEKSDGLLVVLDELKKKISTYGAREQNLSIVRQSNAVDKEKGLVIRNYYCVDQDNDKCEVILYTYPDSATKEKIYYMVFDFGIMRVRSYLIEED